ncbi:HalOD1 output domain-containing protein [Halostella salina]|uniref:HalOD1 output domain-containing protein n=1 Tax=Halostella salina TaxID=1547897 RepID=UPI000EF76049|nr:HalOD1 output domain-containing protein [Halostella salina]
MSAYPTSPVERTARDEPITEAIVWAVAEAKDVDPLDIDVPLYDSIDPDALERILDSDSFEGRIGFSVAGCDVVVYDDRRVVVSEAPDTGTEPSAPPVPGE